MERVVLRERERARGCRGKAEKSHVLLFPATEKLLNHQQLRGWLGHESFSAVACPFCVLPQRPRPCNSHLANTQGIQQARRPTQHPEPTMDVLSLCKSDQLFCIVLLQALNCQSSGTMQICRLSSAVAQGSVIQNKTHETS